MDAMNINEAIEAMKILIPYSARMRAAKDGIGLVRGLLAATTDANEQENIGRLLALMGHQSLEEVTVRLDRDEGEGHALLNLIQCINANPIPDLMDAARILGLTGDGWSND